MKTKSFIILGMGKFGRCLATELMSSGMNVLAVDKDPEKISLIADKVTSAVIADTTDINDVEDLDMGNFDGAIIATTGDLAASVMGVIQAKEAGIPLIIAKASDDIQARVLEKLGATKIIIPENDSAIKIARVLITQDYVDVIPLSENILMAEVMASSKWVGKSIAKIDFNEKYNMNIAAVRMNGELIVNYNPNEIITDNTSLVLVGDKDDFEKLPD